MKTRYESYYRYLNNQKPIVEKRRPDNFTALPGSYVVHCPNDEIAAMMYRTILKISLWRLPHLRIKGSLQFGHD